MTSQNSSYQSHSVQQGNPSCNVQTVNATITQAKISDLLYVPNMNAFIVVTEDELEHIESVSNQYNEIIKQLIEAQNEYENNPDSKTTQIKLSKAKQNIDRSISSLMAGDKFSDTSWIEIHRVHSGKEVYFAPGKIINLKDPAQSRKFYFLTAEDSPENISKLTNPDGTFNRQEFKKAFSEVAANIKLDIASKEGQFSSKCLASLFSPVLSQLLDNQFAALDGYITKLNNALKVSWKQHQNKKSKVIELLENSPVVFEDFGHAQKLAAELWNEQSPLMDVKFTNIDDEKEQEYKNYVVDLVRSQELPPSMFEATAAANLMRWKMGVGLTGEFDLKKGIVSSEVKAEMDVALAEGQLTGSVYIPHNKGFHVKPTVDVKTKQTKWVEFTGGFPERLHFDVNSEFLEIEDVIELANVLSHMGTIRHLFNNDRFKLTVVGHASLTGSKDYNDKLSARRAQMVYGLLTRNAVIWEASFKSGVWGQAQRDYMRQIVSARNLVVSKTESDKALISQYFHACEQYLSAIKIKLPTILPQEFTQQYMIALGESNPFVQTQQEIRLNRRVEFVLLELVEDTEKTTATPLDLGRFRLQLQGHVGGWAGVNIGLATKIELNSHKGQLKVGRSPADAGFKASAFAGAKVETGLAGCLDWSPPEYKQAQFSPLGTVGYMLSTYAGMGAGVEFKIGFDSSINRFLVRVGSSMCVGYGAGGRIEFTVDAKNVWLFIKLVHDQLKKVDFSIVEIFAEEAYEQFIAWSYELIKQGYYFQGVALNMSAKLAADAVNVLSLAPKMVIKFNAGVDAYGDLKPLIEYLEQSPLEIYFAPPEVKGRVLFVLINTPYHYFKEMSLQGFAEKRERAVLHLLQVGVTSKREYLEVLEHMNGRLQTHRQTSDKCDAAAAAQQRLIEFLSDSEDQDRLKNWWNSLADPSDCCCAAPELNRNPIQ